jgi:amidophosphoribosyltransferase
MVNPDGKVDDVMDKREKCGIVGVFSAQGADVVPTVLQGLESLQHRGQESWGIAVPEMPVFLRMGLVTNWINHAKELAGYAGSSAIGHVRYSTKGRSVIENAQPIDVDSEFSIAHNGTLVNADNLLPSISTEFGASCESDTKAAGYRLLSGLRKTGDMFESIQLLSNEIRGAYCFVILDKEGKVFAVRDPRGYRPLSLGWHESSKTFMVASESCALEAVGVDFVRDIEPGEAVSFGGPNGRLESFRFSPKIESAHCSFEYTYFAHPSSRINGISVYEARKRVGEVLAKKFSPEADVVIPVPDSARPAALGFSVGSGIPMDEGLMKDRYQKKGSIRSFIEPEQGRREEVVKKIIPVRDAIKGKNVIVIDDSVVRGTSSRIIVQSLRKAGAKSVKMAVTFPAIRHPCFMGIDFPNRDDLIAHQVARDEKDPRKLATKVADAIGVEKFYYNDIQGLAEAIGLPQESLCFSCVTGDYSKLGLKEQLVAGEEAKS